MSAALVPVVLLGVLLYVRSIPPHVGDFSMPKLDGWRQTTFRTETQQNVSYRKRKPNCSFSISVSWRKNLASNLPQTAQDLQKLVTQRNKLNYTRTTSDGTHYEQGITHPVKFNGLSAVESQMVITYKNRPGLMRWQSIDFVSGKKYYTLSKSVSTSAPTITPAMQMELDEALAEVTQAMQPS